MHRVGSLLDPVDQSVAYDTKGCVRIGRYFVVGGSTELKFSPPKGQGVGLAVKATPVSGKGEWSAKGKSELSETFTLKYEAKLKSDTLFGKEGAGLDGGKLVKAFREKGRAGWRRSSRSC